MSLVYYVKYSVVFTCELWAYCSILKWYLLGITSCSVPFSNRTRVVLWKYFRWCGSAMGFWVGKEVFFQSSSCTHQLYLIFSLLSLNLSSFLFLSYLISSLPASPNISTLKIYFWFQPFITILNHSGPNHIVSPGLLY